MDKVDFVGTAAAETRITRFLACPGAVERVSKIRMEMASADRAGSPSTSQKAHEAKRT